MNDHDKQPHPVHPAHPDTQGMAKGHNAAWMEKRILETHAHVTGIKDLRPRVKAAVSHLIDDAEGIALAVQAGTMTIEQALADIRAMRDNLDPHWLDMGIDGK